VRQDVDARPERLVAVATDAAGEDHVAGLDGDALGVEAEKVGVLEEGDEVGLGSLLEGHDGGGLEAEVVLELVGNLTNQALEGELADEKLGGALESLDLAEGDGAGAVAVSLLDGADRGGSLASSLAAESSLAGELATLGLVSSMLGASHCLSKRMGEAMGRDTKHVSGGNDRVLAPPRTKGLAAEKVFIQV